MAFDTEQREFETRKLEALASISVAIATLGTNLTAIVKETSTQGQVLQAVDQKVDVIIRMLTAMSANG